MQILIIKKFRVKSISAIVLALTMLVLASAGSADVEQQRTTDLVAAGADAWRSPDPKLWSFKKNSISGRSPEFGAPRKAPESSAWLLSKQVFGGDIIEVHIDVTFSHGRYLAIYMDYDQAIQTGIWMATGHPVLEPDPTQHMNVEAAYIKTVERGNWVVRTEGELVIKDGVLKHLIFAKHGDDYSIYDNGRLIITYRKPGYQGSELQLRIVDAGATITHFEVKSDWVRDKE